MQVWLLNSKKAYTSRRIADVCRDLATQQAYHCIATVHLPYFICNIAVPADFTLSVLVISTWYARRQGLLNPDIS